jgi:hypothetical protein
MAKVRIDAGACGIETLVEVERAGEKRYSLKVGSACEMVERLARELPELDMLDVFKKVLDNPVYRSASLCLRHVSCPVPCGILKALEAEAGLAVPRAVSITFIEEAAED